MENSKGHTILLVDDEPDILEFLSYNIRKEGYKVFTANNGEEGVKLTQQLSPSLILLDVMMPFKDGLTLAKEIRVTNKQIPIICKTTAPPSVYKRLQKEYPNIVYCPEFLYPQPEYHQL
jgi:DNA-binding response OmpR family regulator